MKKLLWLLAFSLAANAALIVTFVVRPFDHRHDGTSAGAVGATPAGFPATPVTGLSAADAGALQRSGRLLATGDDLQALVAQLRAAGFPPALVRGIIMARLAEQFGARRLAAVAHQPALPYWKFSTTYPFPYDPKAGEQVHALVREQAALAKELLGPDAAAPDAWSQLIRQRKYGNLPPDKIDRLESITSDYTDLRKEIATEARGLFLPEDQQKMALLEQEQRADIAKLFTPEELEDYDLRNSPTAQNLRSRLAGFNPTEEEFRTIFELIQSAQSGSGNAGQPGSLPAAITAALDPARAAEYLQTTNPAYQQVSQLLNRFDLPSSAATQIVSLQQDTQQRAAAIQQDRTLSAEARTAQLATLAQETRTSLAGTLGTRGFEAYMSYGGWWLNNLTPRPVPVRAPRN